MKSGQTSLQVAVEMPFDIKSLNCPSHKVKVKVRTFSCILVVSVICFPLCCYKKIYAYAAIITTLVTTSIADDITLLML